MSASALAEFLGLPKATEELIAMLSEREVEFLTYGNDPTYVIWDQWTWAETKTGYVTLTAHPVTPEQAVEATLGRGTCHKVRVHEVIEDEMCCSECGRFLGFAGDIGAPPYNYCPNCGRRIVQEVEA